MALCRILGVSRSAYYAYRAGKSYVLQKEKAMISAEIKTIFTRATSASTSGATAGPGYSRTADAAELRHQGLAVGRHQIRNRMQQQDLVAIQPKSFVPKTTQSHPHLRRGENLLLAAENLPTGPNQVIVGDITYLPNQEAGYDKWLYLGSWLYLKSHRMVGWQIERHMEEGLVLLALQKVIRSRQPKQGFIVHSDGGRQYASSAFRALLRSLAYGQSYDGQGQRL